jgi:hypothetical protein
MDINRTSQTTIGLAAVAVLTIGCLGMSAQPYPRSDEALADARMSGTYELERTRGDDPKRAAETATRSIPAARRDRAYQRLLARLEPPQMLSIERDGRQISIESSRGPRSSFDANGRMQHERGADGRIVATRVEIKGSELRVSTSGGSRGSDFSVTFASLDKGAGLRVTRRLDDDDLAKPVTIESRYRRTSARPRWDIHTFSSGNDAGNPDRFDDRTTAGAAVVPNGTRLVAVLDTPLSMRTSRTGQAFAMTVRSPAEFRDARIDGVVSRSMASGDDGDMRVDFRTIQWRGRSSDFDGVLDTVRLSDGSVLRVNEDGDVPRTDGNGRTVQNGAIGAAVGAIIGAFAGGGTGAAVGAVAGGAGGVILSRGHERLELARGSEVTLTSTAW